MALKRSQSSCNDVSILQFFDRTDIDKLFRAKMEYGQLFLFKSDNIYTILRPLTVLESETIASFVGRLHETVIEDWVFDRCLIISTVSKDYLFSKSKCFYIKNIVTKLYLLSNIQDIKEYNKQLLLERNKANSVQNLLETIIAKGYNSDHTTTKNMTQRKQFEVLAKAEKITGDLLQISNNKENNKKALRRFSEEAVVVGAEDITSPEVADKPDF